MPQFRPLPKFDEVEVAEQTEAQPIDTTDAFPTLSPHTTGHVPVLLLSGSQCTCVTEQLAVLASKPPTTAKRPSLTSALQVTLSAPDATKPLVVIHAEAKRKKAPKIPAKHMSLRLRHTLVICATLVVLFGMLISLSPLSDGANGKGFFQDFNSWLHSMQNALGIQMQGHTITKADLNANLPFMNIPDSPYVPFAEQDAINAGISPIYFVRQIAQESGFNPKAVSVTNAQGIAQFEPGTAAGLGINPWDPIQALQGAALLMSRYNQKYGGNYAMALGAYNAGTGNIQAAVNACGANWLNCAPAQTRDYVYRIMGI